MDKDIPDAIQKLGAQTFNRKISWTIRVRQMIYNAFERRPAGISERFNFRCFAPFASVHRLRT